MKWTDLYAVGVFEFLEKYDLLRLRLVSSNLIRIVRLTPLQACDFFEDRLVFDRWRSLEIQDDSLFSTPSRMLTGNIPRDLSAVTYLRMGVANPHTAKWLVNMLAETLVTLVVAKPSLASCFSATNTFLTESSRSCLNRDIQETQQIILGNIDRFRALEKLSLFNPPWLDEMHSRAVLPRLQEVTLRKLSFDCFLSWLVVLSARELKRIEFCSVGNRKEEDSCSYELSQSIETTKRKATCDLLCLQDCVPLAAKTAITSLRCRALETDCQVPRDTFDLATFDKTRLKTLTIRRYHAETVEMFLLHSNLQLNCVRFVCVLPAHCLRLANALMLMKSVKIVDAMFSAYIVQYLPESVEEFRCVVPVPYKLLEGFPFANRQRLRFLQNLTVSNDREADLVVRNFSQCQHLTLLDNQYVSRMSERVTNNPVQHGLPNRHELQNGVMLRCLRNLKPNLRHLILRLSHERNKMVLQFLNEGDLDSIQLEQIDDDDLLEIVRCKIPLVKIPSQTYIPPHISGIAGLHGISVVSCDAHY